MRNLINRSIVLGLGAAVLMYLFFHLSYRVAVNYSAKADSPARPAVADDDVFSAGCVTMGSYPRTVTLHFCKGQLVIDDPCNVMDEAARIFFNRYLKKIADAYIRERLVAKDTLSPNVQDYARGANDALDAVVLHNLELDLTGQTMAWRDRIEVVRGRLGLPKNGDRGTVLDLGQCAANQIDVSSIIDEPNGITADVPTSDAVPFGMED